MRSTLRSTGLAAVSEGVAGSGSGKVGKATGGISERCGRTGAVVTWGTYGDEAAEEG